MARLRYAGQTDVGIKRDHNEDNFTIIETDCLFVVADGMGGHASGEVASKLACEVLTEFYARTRDEEVTWPFKMDVRLGYHENRLSCGVRLANLRIFQTASSEAGKRGMGTTVVALSIVGEKMYVGHVGDSRCYRLRKGRL